MKRLIIFIIWSLSLVSGYAQTPTAQRTAYAILKEYTILTEDCILQQAKYRDKDRVLCPVFYDEQQKTIFYVKVEKGHVRTHDLTAFCSK